MPPKLPVLIVDFLHKKPLYGQELPLVGIGHPTDLQELFHGSTWQSVLQGLPP